MKYARYMTPIFYAVCLVPVIALTIAVVQIFESTIGFLFGMTGMVEAFVSVAVIGTTVYWFASKVMSRWEKQTKHGIADHIRQSALYYLLIVALVVNFYVAGYHGGLQEAVAATILFISIWAVIVNVVFARIKNKKMQSAATR